MTSLLPKCLPSPCPPLPILTIYFFSLDFHHGFFLPQCTRLGIQLNMRKKVVWECSCLVPDLEGKTFKISPLKYLFEFYEQIPFFRWKLSASPSLLSISSINTCWILLNAFSVSTEMFFFLIYETLFKLWMWLITLMDFSNVKSTMCIRISPTTRWWYIIFFIYCGICQISVQDFYIFIFR